MPGPTTCTTFDIPDGDPRYNSPLPWVGLYIAVASLLCTVFMVRDLWCSIRRRRHWIAPGVLSLNATMLAILGVAAKLPSDITTAMPGVFDQLARLSGMVLVCVVINHVLPSLGLMSGMEIVSNVAALGILVVTTSVNIWIQESTGVASSLLFYNSYFSIAMMVMYIAMVSFSLSIVPTMKILEQRYNSRHHHLAAETRQLMMITSGLVPPEVLKVYMVKYWLLALTSSPDYILRSSGLSAFNAVICHASLGANFISVTISLLKTWGHTQGPRPCYMNSAYHWTTPVVFAFQAVTIVVGTIGSLLRSLNSKTTRSFSSWNYLFTIEKRWVHLLLEWRETPLTMFEDKGRNVRLMLRFFKKLVCDILLNLQIAAVFFCKLFLLIHIQMWRLIIFPKKLILSVLGAATPSNSVLAEEAELTGYVLHLEENEEDNSSASKVVRKWKEYPLRWIRTGQSRQPSHLIRFLIRYKTDLLREHPKTWNASNVELQALDYWSLSLATLVTISRVDSNAGRYTTTPLFIAIREAFKYARFVEKNFDYSITEKALVAAETVWEGLDLDYRWLDVNLDSFKTLTWTRSIKILRDAAAKQLQADSGTQNVTEYLPREHAAHCMILYTEWILSNVESSNRNGTRFILMKELEKRAALIMVRCLRNLPQVLLRRCWNSELGRREDGVRESSILLGETEDLIRFLIQLYRHIGNYHKRSSDLWSGEEEFILRIATVEGY